jgi:outer membrane protein OmpA-like peptidoglycan-associated protein
MYPVAGNDTSEDREMNRRVEIILSNDKGAIRQR